jgi:proteasome activator subunit 4
MSQDGPPAPASNAPTPSFTPLPSGMSTPQLRAGGASGNLLKEFLSAPLPKAGAIQTTYLAGSRALDSLAKLIASTESFFHPSNSGTWTADVCHHFSNPAAIPERGPSLLQLSALIKCIMYEFNKRKLSYPNSSPLQLTRGFQDGTTSKNPIAKRPRLATTTLGTA